MCHFLTNHIQGLERCQMSKYTHTWTKKTGSIVTFHKQQAQVLPLRIPYSGFFSNPNTLENTHIC